MLHKFKVLIRTFYWPIIRDFYINVHEEQCNSIIILYLNEYLKHNKIPKYIYINGGIESFKRHLLNKAQEIASNLRNQI